jgi:pimeloyl-ACP methyl ester carboxylesterase
VKGTEIQATGKLAGDALGGTGALIRDVHRGVSSRIFTTLGPIGAPVKLAHDGISTAVYASVRAGLRLTPRALTPFAPAGPAALHESPAGSAALGAINGMWGDRVAQEYPPLALPMTLKGEPGDRVAVFVHGLCETDAAWRLGGGPTYGERLREDLGYAPVYARYNTGRHISDNGRALAAALDELEASEIVLIGHSMGGLVARSACHYADTAASRIRHVVCLGSPHMGAPLERAANRGAHLLGRLPETSPFARLLTIRSAGLKDLRYGACVEEDWDGFDPDEYLCDRCTEVPFLEGATYCFIGATVTRRKEGLLADVLGDLLVQFPSASGDHPTRRLAFEIENGFHLGGVNHIQLLNHPKVYAQLKRWLTA